jgi:hypothetical protein
MNLRQLKQEAHDNFQRKYGAHPTEFDRDYIDEVIVRTLTAVEEAVTSGIHPQESLVSVPQIVEAFARFKGEVTESV